MLFWPQITVFERSFSEVRVSIVYFLSAGSTSYSGQDHKTSYREAEKTKAAGQEQWSSGGHRLRASDHCDHRNGDPVLSYMIFFFFQEKVEIGLFIGKL